MQKSSAGPWMSQCGCPRTPSSITSRVAYLSAAVHWFIVSARRHHGCRSSSIPRRVPSSRNVSSPLLTTATTTTANATAVLVAATVLVVATRGHHRPVVPRRMRIDDRQTTVERRLTTDCTLLHRKRQTRLLGKTVTARHALAGQTVGEITWIRQNI